MYNASGHKRPRLTLDQIAPNQIPPQNEHVHSTHRPIIATTVFPTSSPVDAAIASTARHSSSVSSAPSTLASPDTSPHEPLNLSFSNRSTPTTSTHEPVSHKKVTQQEPWPPDPYRATTQYRDHKDYRSRRDSADSCDQATSSIKSEDAADEAGKERRRRQKLANKDNLFCQVCGDKANGYNFGAITCESCKAFFRRNAQKNKDLKCNFENACKIDHFTRKFCTACRLNKCFSVNMKKEWILDEDALKKRKKLTRRSVKEESSSSDFDHSFFPTAFTTSQMYGASNVPLLAHPTLFMCMEPVLQMGPEQNSEDQDYPPQALGEEERAEIERIVENYTMMDSTSSASSTATTPTVPQPISINPKIVENHSTVYAGSSTSPEPYLPQQSTSDPLLINIKTEPPSEPYVVVQPEDPPEDSTQDEDDTTDEEKQEFSHPDQILAGDPFRKLAEDYFNRLIQFIRFLPEFESLSKHDQFTLLKGGILEAFIIRSAIVFEETGNEADEGSSSRDDQAKTPSTESPGQFHVTKDMVSEHIKFIKKFNAVAKWDKVIMILGTIVHLFSADRSDLQNREVIARTAQRYALLMQAYLRSKYSFLEARSLYPQIIFTLRDVRAYSQVFSQQMATVTLAELEPLMREMFSMK